MRESFDDFMDQYMATLLWTEHIIAEDGEDYPANTFEESYELWGDLLEMARDFYRGWSHFWREHGWSDSDAGHDFALTRNRHGTGFWDRGRNGGQELTNACRPYGEVHLYLDANDQLRAEE